ncbi:MAG: alpha-2-macroglobulin family protein [Chloroflexota bacterium]
MEKAVYAIEVTADDGSNQPVSSSFIFTVHSSSEKVSLTTSSYFHPSDEPFQVTASVSDFYDQPVSGRELTLTINPWSNKTYEFAKGQDKFTLVTDEKGQAVQELSLPSGYYELELTGKDGPGNSMSYTRWVYIFKDKGSWFEPRYDQINIVADSESYKPYQKARFIIESSFSGPALLTFERGHVINTKLIELTAPLTVVETNVIPEYAPNVYVTVNAWHAPPPIDEMDQYERWGRSHPDSQLSTDSVEISVAADAKALQVTISTDKEVYAPRESMTATIEVRDSSGQPVTAEVSLVLVDEAIFALSEELSPNIFEAFYGPRRLTVDTYDSMAPYRYFDYGGAGGGGDDRTSQSPRSDFPDTAAWFPALQTDSTGKVSVTIELPDSLTRWRLTAKAVTLTHKVGQGQANFETKQEVLVRPVLPRSLTSGDQAHLSAFVHNYGDTTRTFDVKLEAPGLEVQNEAIQKVTVEPGAVIPVGWQVIVEGVTATEVTISATSPDGAADAVRLPLPIQPVAVLDIQNQSGEFTGTLALALPLPEVQPETSTVTLHLSRTMSNTLLNGLEYLTGYPYGCIEQTMSRALPNAVVARASESLGLGGIELKRRVDPLVIESLHRLYGFQHDNGGWGWWFDDDSDDYQTAWVLFGLGLIAEAGYEVDATVISEGVNYLNHRLDDMDIRTRAYALYSMTLVGQGDLDQTQALATASLHELDPFSQAALALAFQRMGETEQAKTILGTLSNRMAQKGDKVYWPQLVSDGQYSRKTMASTRRTTAMVLAAYVAIDPQNPLIPGMVDYLIGERQGRQGWGTTNETTFAILGLTDYLVSQEEQDGQVLYVVTLGGKSLSSGVLEPGNNSVALKIPLDKLERGLNTLLIETEGGSKVYFDLSTRFDLPQSQVEAAGSIRVTRRYTDPKTKNTLETFQPGQLVRVELTVNVPKDASYFAIEDHLPGGFEALNEGLNTASHSNAYSSSFYSNDHYFWGEYLWKDYGYNFKEIRGDRVVFFITDLPQGTRTLTYLARVTTTGTFVAMPTEVYAMYDLSMWGRSASDQIEISAP